ncbi:unknown protein [Microcystis aeruginosa NIES-843]|uniref:Uncharacterized protein n=1 Tax=Microcystis aeruginosa (strain NIES-843 / IAM M-2473) TaxID=449447 RepID=B0JNX2_MICAN|nr:unknown protein [Microcystis aeruginosa NIES-843]
MTFLNPQKSIMREVYCYPSKKQGISTVKLTPVKPCAQNPRLSTSVNFYQRPD